MTNTEILLNLIKDNPDLPIIPWVDSEIVADDSWARWLGSFGYSCIGEYAVYEDNRWGCTDYRYFDDRDDFKEHYYDCNDDELCEKFNYNPAISEYAVNIGKFTQEEFEMNHKNEEHLEDYLDKIAEEYFTKAIILNIDLPN